MKKKILILTIAAIVATPTAFAAYDGNVDANNGTNDDAADIQTVSVTVPEVALLNISDTPVTLDNTGLHAPTTAGAGFTGSATGTTTYDISSNVLNTGDPDNATAPTSRKITVMTDPVVGKVPDGAELQITVTAPTGATTGTAKLVSPTSTSSTSTPDSANAIGNTTGTGLNIAYALSADPAGTGMIAHTANDGADADNIGLIYTLTDD